MRPNGTDCFALMNFALLYNANSLKSEMDQPGNFEPTRVNVSLHMESFRMLDSASMMFQITFLLNQYWFDERLGANRFTYENRLNGRIWMPKISNVNGQNRCCKDNEDAMFWRVYGDDGLVFLSQKLVVTNFCESDLQNFPFDTPTCSLSFGSYRFTEEEVSLNWRSSFIDYRANDFSLHPFSLSNISHASSTLARESGNFSALEIAFNLERNSGQYILFVAMPCLCGMVLLYSTLWIGNRGVQRGIGGFTLLYFLYLLYNVSNIFQGSAVNLLTKFVLKNICFGLIAAVKSCFDHNFASSGNDKWRKCHSAFVHAWKLVFPLVYVVLLFLV